MNLRNRIQRWMPLIAAQIALAATAGAAPEAVIDMGETNLDPNSGLIWLDLDQTAGHSFQTIERALGSSGWRFATAEEVSTLWTNMGIAVYDPYDPATHFGDPIAVQNFFDVFGLLRESPKAAYGWIDPEDYCSDCAVAPMVAVYDDPESGELYGTYAAIYGYTLETWRSLDFIGSYLVRESPVPSDPFSELVSYYGSQYPIHVVWDEDVDGDLGTTYISTSTPIIELKVGLNVVLGEWFWTWVDSDAPFRIFDLDSFGFITPPGTQLEAMRTSRYAERDEKFSHISLSYVLLDDIGCIWPECDPGYDNAPWEILVTHDESTYPGSCPDDPAEICRQPDNLNFVPGRFGMGSYDLEFGGALPRLFEAPAAITVTGIGAAGAGTLSELDGSTIRVKYAWGLLVTRYEIEADFSVLPSRDADCVRLDGRGVIPVAIFGSEELDVTQINQSSLTLSGLQVGARGNHRPMCSFDQANSDSFPDLVCQFQDELQVVPNDGASISLLGKLYDGVKLAGTNTICFAN